MVTFICIECVLQIMYILCDNVEFAIYMDKIYGKGNWYGGPDGYYALDERDGKYKPTGWYATDFE